MSNSCISSNNCNAISELDKKTGEPVFITKKGEECEKMLRHRDAVYAAELSRRSGEPACSQSELGVRMEELFNAAEG